jgi:hypothetical protein
MAETTNTASICQTAFFILLSLRILKKLNRLYWACAGEGENVNCGMAPPEKKSVLIDLKCLKAFL